MTDLERDLRLSRQALRAGEGGLDPARRTRLWARIESQRRAENVRWRVGLALTVGAAAVALAVILWPPAGARLVSGRLKTARATVFAGDRVPTVGFFEALGPATIGLPGGGDLRMVAGAQLELTEPDRVRLASGEVIVRTSVALVVLTPETQIDGVSARFVVHRIPAGTEIAVTDGQVLVTHATGARMVRVGHRHFVPARGPRRSPAAGRERFEDPVRSDRPDGTALPGKTGQPHSPVRANPRNGPASPAAAPTDRTAQLGVADTARLPPLPASAGTGETTRPNLAPEPRPAPEPGQFRLPPEDRTESTVANRPTDASVGRRPAGPDHRAAPEPAPTKVDPLRLMETADSHRRGGRLRAAADVYAKVVASQAATTLREEAILRRAQLLTELGSPAEAMAALRQAQALGPGLLAPERGALEAELLLGAGRTEAAAEVLERHSRARALALHRVRLLVAEALTDRVRAERLLAPVLATAPESLRRRARALLKKEK